MRTSNSITRTLTGAFLFSLAGCAIHVDLPNQFLVTVKSSSEFKATTADDAIFIVEKYQLPEKGGNLDFWVTALKNQFVENLGYVLLEEEAIETNDGEKGMQMMFETTIQGQAYRYLICAFVQEGPWPWSDPIVRVVRFTAEKEKFDEHLDDVKKAMRTTRG